MKRRMFGMGVLGMALAIFAAGAAVGDDKDDKNKPLDDSEFVKKAASSGMLEVKVSENAQSKVSNPDVRQFAAKMVVDHVKANNELKTIAQAVPVTVPDIMMEKHQKELERLRDIKGENYDREFMDFQVKAHEEAVELFRKASTDVKNPQLKQFAARTLPTLEGHLRMAKDLQSRVKK